MVVPSRSWHLTDNWTELELDAQGLLSRITNAAHESVHAEYTDGGLLAR